MIVDPAGAAEARATVAAMLAGFDEGRDTRDLRDAQAVLETGLHAIVPAPASTSTSAPSATR